MSTQKTTHSHIFSIEPGGVAIHLTSENFHQGCKEGKIFLTPAEAHTLAQAIRGDVSLPDGDSAQEAQYEIVVEEVSKRFLIDWKPRGSGADMMDLERQFYNAYSSLKVEEGSATNRWYNATFFTGLYSYKMQEALFWRYFERSKQREDLIKHCFPELWQSWQGAEENEHKEKRG